MTAENLDLEPAATVTDTTTGTADSAPPAAPAPPPAGQDAADAADADELDLLADDGEADEPADGEGADPGDAKATDAPQHDREAYVYEPPEGTEITEIGRGRIDAFAEYAHKNGMAPEAYQGALNFYNELVKQEQAHLADADKALRTETRDTLTERWGDSYEERIKIAKEGARVLPQALRAMLKEARTPDGRRIANTVELRQALFEIGRLRTRKGNPMPPDDETRLAEIAKIRDTQGIDEYRAKGLDRESLEIMRRIDAAKTQARVPGTLTPAEEAEERELIQMMQTDIHAYSRPFRGLGITGSDRLLQLRRKRDGAAA